MLNRKVFSLEAASVDLASNEIEDFLSGVGVEREIIVQNRLFAEEILLDWIEAHISASFVLTTGFRYRKPVVILEAEGAPLNVFEKRDDENHFLLKNLLNSLGRYPVYSYINGKNSIRFNFPEKKKNKMVRIILAILSAILCGFALSFLLGPELCKRILTDVIDPLYSTALRILSFISGPLILLSVTWGIYGIGDLSTLNLVGKKMIFRFLFVVFLVAFAVTMGFPLFRFEIGAAADGSSAFKAIFEMILDIIPPNIVEPFSSGNTLHIIFLAVIVGIAMLYLGQRVSTVADLVQEINCIVQFLMAFISNLMPYYIFLIVLRLMLNGSLSIIFSVWQLLLLYIAAVLLLAFVFTLWVCIRQKVSPGTLLKKSAATLLIAFTTASSAAAFSSNVETCEKKFGIDSSLCAFGIPLGMVMFKTATTVYYVLVSLFFAKQYAVPVSPDWIFSAMFVSAILSIASPPIPGGAMVAYTMLFARLHLPNEALAIGLSMDMLFDFVRTAANLYILSLELISIGSIMGKLNTDILREKTAE